MGIPIIGIVFILVMILASAALFLLYWDGEILRDFGIDPALRGAYGLITSSIFIGIVIAVIWSARSRVPEGDDPTDDYLTRNWHIIATIITLIIYITTIAVM